MLRLEALWYRKSYHWMTLLLLPLSWLFYALTRLRFYCYHFGILHTYQAPVPVIVVGNISVGGTGKTPFVIWLVNFLRAQGLRPGIVSRGVGGRFHHEPHQVRLSDAPSYVGDEALLLVQETSCPMMIGANRALAVQYLLQIAACDVVISDDGLQHYGLGRSVEIAIIDGVRALGNQCLLPAGPLREPVSRLSTLDFVVVNGRDMQLQPSKIIALKDAKQIFPPQTFPHKKVHAVAGIGHPQRFFNELRALGFEIIEHAFPDHYLYREIDFHFGDTLPILMTAKDAVKCQKFADERFWCMHVDVRVEIDLQNKLAAKIYEEQNEKHN